MRAAIAVVLSSCMVAAGLAFPLNASPQSPASAQSLSFEVATIKANKSGDDRAYSSIQPGGRLSATNVTLRDLMLAAYRFKYQPSQIVGGPDWMTSERFDIEAKAPSGRNPTDAEIAEMLRALLSERFRLAVHEEAREFPTYVLLMERSDGRLGARLAPSSGTDCVDPGPAPERGPRPAVDPKGPQPCGRISYRPDGWSARGVTTDQIARALEAFVGRLVVNRTELTGRFNIDLEFTRDLGVPTSPIGQGGLDRPADSRTSIFTALREQLGLRLDSQKGSVGVLVIDRAERPTAN
jgi:bla regulator protein blaR1